jgi:hypothetical protein
MQSGEDYVLKVPSKGFFLAVHILDGLTFDRREGASQVAATALRSRGSSGAIFMSELFELEY